MKETRTKPFDLKSADRLSRLIERLTPEIEFRGPVQFDALDMIYLHDGCDQHGTRPRLEEALTRIPVDVRVP